MTASSTYLPPDWMVRDAVDDVVRRRLHNAPAFQQLIQSRPDTLQRYLEWNGTYALLALYPASERVEVEKRIRRFGQAFPGLFNINGEARPHDLRDHGRNAPGFTGLLEIKKRGPLISGRVPFKTTFRTSCLFRIEPDASIKIGGVRIKSDHSAPKRFAYRIYFSYIVAFGRVLTPFNFLEYLESELILNFGLQPDGLQRQMISEVTTR